MYTTNSRKFKGEIEKYLAKEKNIFESRIDCAFRILNFKTQLNRAKIGKRDGYHAAHLLFILALLPLLKISIIHSFSQKKWFHWCIARKDAFYRFRQTPCRWRSFLHQVLIKISEMLEFKRYPLKKRYFVIDDSPMPKRGRNIENVSFIYDHNLGRSILGFPLSHLVFLLVKTSTLLTLPIGLAKLGVQGVLKRKSETLEVSVAK